MKIDGNNQRNWNEWQKSGVGRIHRVYCKMHDFKKDNPDIDPSTHQEQYDDYWRVKMDSPNLGTDLYRT